MAIKRPYVAQATYDFAVSGGAVSTITLPGYHSIPINGLITNVRVDVQTIVTSAGAAEIALTAGGVTLKAAETIANCEYDATGLVDVIRAGNAGATGTAKYIPIKATSTAGIAIAITVAALTAGKLNVWVEYSY